MEKIKNLIVFDGKVEYKNESAYSNPKIQGLISGVIGFSGISTMIEKINAENGAIYIHSNEDFSVGKLELRNVSNEIKEEYQKKRP
jgi:hypothetical protein